MGAIGVPLSFENQATPRFDDLMLDCGDDDGLVWERINPLIHPVGRRVLAA